MSNAEHSLYERLGGYDAIAQFMLDFIHRVRADARFTRFGGGRGTDNKLRNDQLSIEYICALAGGPVYYMGRDYEDIARGLEDYARRVEGEYAASRRCAGRT